MNRGKGTKEKAQKTYIDTGTHTGPIIVTKLETIILKEKSITRQRTSRNALNSFCVSSFTDKPWGDGLDGGIPYGTECFKELLWAHCPAMAACVCSYLLHEEASMMIAEQDTDLEYSWMPLGILSLLHSFSKRVEFVFP